jgi:pilus retraction protein PilT
LIAEQAQKSVGTTSLGEKDMEKFQKIIEHAIKDIASDIYIAGGHPVVSRRSGNIQFHGTTRFTHQEVDDLVKELLSARQLQELRERKSFDVAVSLSNARLRINVFTTTRGLSLAIRILPGHIPTIDELNLHPSLHEITKLKSGMILNCGATGVGKSTTIAAIINDINNVRPAHIVTLENPIEYRFPTIKSFIQQRELGTNMPSFSQGLLDVLRESPDVIVVGELREGAVMQLTIDAAESGHLVIATLHASTPEEAIYRLCNSVPVESQNEIRNQLASTLQWLIVQQLVYIERIGFRVPVLTIVRASISVRNIIRENKLHQLQNAVSSGKNDGMFTSERYLSEYLDARQKFTHPDTIFRPSTEKLNEAIYQSPLLEEAPEAISVTKRSPAPDKRAVEVRNDSSGNPERTLTIDESGESLDSVIRDLPT